MAARAHKRVDDDNLDDVEWPEGVDFVSREEWLEMLDHDTRLELGMSAQEFIKAYRAGEFRGDGRSIVSYLGMLIPDDQ